MLDALPAEQLAQVFVLVDGHRTHQHRLALGVAGLDLLNDRPVLGVFGLVHHVVVVLAGQGTVGGNLNDIQFIDGAELLLLRQGRTGHTGELGVQAEIVLEGDGRQGLALPLHLHPLLGLNRLVQTLAVAASEHEAACELVHNDDLAVLDHIVDVLFHHAVGLDSLVDMVVQGGVLRVGQIFHMEILLRFLHALGGKGSGAGLLVHDIVLDAVLILLRLLVGLGNDGLLQGPDKHLRHVVHLGGLLPHTGNNQGGAGLVDEDGVHLVHDGEVVAPLDQLAAVESHVVPQVIEPHLVVGTVGNIGGVSLLPLGLVQTVDNQAHGQAQEAIDLAHPLAVALGQVVVDGDDVDALSGQGVEVSGQGCHQGLAFTGLHLGDTALMEDHAAHQLHPVGPHSQHPDGRLPRSGKGFGKNIVQALAISQAFFEPGRLGGQLRIGESLILRLQGFDLINDGIDLLQFPVAVSSE